MQHHVNPLDSTDFCKENGVPDIAKNLSKCSSCIGRCGDIMNQTKNEVCSCDVLCMAHKECCGDFELLCTDDFNTAQSINQHYDGLKSTCVSVNHVPHVGRPTPTHAAMVTACSNNSVPCDFDFMDAHSILTYGGPVVDSLHGVTFVNYKCAMCNDIPLWRVKPLEALLLCDPSPVMDMNYLMLMLNSNQSFSVDKNPWFIKDNNFRKDLLLDPKTIVREVLSTSGCYLGFHMENSQRRCVQRIDTCPETCTNTDLVKLCFTAPHGLVTANVNGKPVTYRNIYCGLCNYGRDIGFGCGFIGSLGVIPNGLLSLSLLFDVHRNHGIVIQSVEANCKRNDQRLPGNIKCGQVVCPIGYIHTGHGCSKEQVEFEANVTSTFHIVIEPTNCSQTNNSDVLIDELRTAFISELSGHTNTSTTNVRIEMSHICLLTSNYSLGVFVSIKGHEDRSQNISDLLQNIGVKTVWYVFRGIFFATNTSRNTIRITSGNTSVTFSNENIKQAECDGFLQIADSSTFHNVLSQSENTTSNVSKRQFGALSSSSLICMKNENQSKRTEVSEGLGYVTIVLSSLFFFASHYDWYYRRSTNHITPHHAKCSSSCH